MTKLPHLSGREVLKILVKAGFIVSRQKRSHVILTKIIGSEKKAIVVPDHKEVDIGTLIERV